MHTFASFNHEIFPVEDIKINAISSASHYGKGVFTTIAIHNSKPFLWEKHWNRLNNTSRKLGVDLSEFTEQRVCESLQQIIEKNNVINGRCRITFFDESSSTIWQTSNRYKTSILIQTADLREVKKDISLIISPFPVNSRSPIAGVKSCNYLESLISLEHAKSRGFDEAIRLNEKGEITSACMANIFWVKNDEVYTPSLETGCVAGTMREFVLENSEVFEIEENLKTLNDVDAIFLTSSGIELSIASINNKSVSNNRTAENIKQIILSSRDKG